MSELKKGDKVWVLCEVRELGQGKELKVGGPLGGVFWVVTNYCKPVEPEASKKLNTVTFDIGDPVMSYDGRKGIVEAINVIEDFPITVRHSMREQVSYRFGGVKHDDDPMGKEDAKQSSTTESDAVNHPSHYNQGPIECIEAIKAATGEGFVSYIRGNILKYLWRWPKKNGIEDLKKAQWYLDRLIKEVDE